MLPNARPSRTCAQASRKMADRHIQSELADNSGGPFPTDPGKPPSPGSLRSTLSGSPSPRPGSTPLSATAKSPHKGGAYWFASSVGEDSGDHSHYSAHEHNPKECYWFAQAAELPSPSSDLNTTAPTAADDFDDADGRDQIDREERLRLLRERQLEERQRRIDDIKLATLHAQKFREEQEEKRRLKLEELKSKEHERRAMVEERKKQIWEAERGRKEAILKKNMEREARIEAIRNASRSSIGFAFGSSTPRLLEGEQGIFSTRRATSQSNMSMLSSSSRNSAERELVKKRMSSSTYVSNHRAGDAGSSPVNDVQEINVDPWNGLKEDMSSSFSSSSGRLELFPFPRAVRFSGNLTGSGVFVGEDLMTKSCSALMSGPPPNRGRRKTDLIPTIPAHESPRNQSPATRTTPSSPSRPNSSMSQQSLSSHASQSSTVSMRNRMTARRPRPVSIAGTPTAEVNRMTADERLGRSTERRSTTPTGKPPRAKSVGADRILSDASLSAAKPAPAPRKPSAKSAKPLPPTPKPMVDKPKIPPKPAKVLQKADAQMSPSGPAKLVSLENLNNNVANDKAGVNGTPASAEPREHVVESEKPAPPSDVVTNGIDSHEVEAPPDEGSVAPSKTRITTEEEAKAAIAERRRIAREQAEREAELERQRQEELKRQELERIRLEEEERQRWEQEQDMLRKAEEERLQRAIDEQQAKEEEERKKKEDEARLKQEKEEADRKVREEQEKVRKETEERLRREEEERAERRKRVEAIMSRTRNKGGNNTPVTTPTKAEDIISEKFAEKTSDAVQLQRLDGDSCDSPAVEQMEFAPSSEQSVVNADLAETDVVSEEVKNNPTDDDKSQLTQHQLIDFDEHVKDTELIDHSSSLFNNTQKTEPLVDLPHLMGEVIPLHTNGFGGKEEKEFVVGTKSCETKSNIIDSFDEFDLLKARASPSSPQQPLVEFEQLIDLNLTSSTTTTKTEEFLNNADNVNSNLPTNGPGVPFIAFEDNFVQKQETNISDL